MRFAAAFLVLVGCATQVAVVAQPPVPENPDLDGDGIANAIDQCPRLAEDCDQFEDEDGCPELDDDHDQLLDACDQCPRLPEDWNGYADDDGCPDRKVIILREEVRIIPTVLFRHGSARVLETSLPFIDDIAQTMASFPDLELVRISGHAAMNERNVLELSQKRAEAVRELLVQRGVAAARLEVVGEGDAKPLEQNLSEEGRAKNRRVDFQIIRRKEPTPEPPRANYRPERAGCPGGKVPAPYDVRHCKE